ncbi:MAG: hypothetical protein WCT20_00235 [Candidatus Babeliales bacterium]
MRKRLLFLMWLPVFSQSHAGIFDFFTHKEATTEEKIADLRKQQIDYPEDPLINYNLGVALYKQSLFDQARVAFRRAVDHSEEKKYGILKLQSLFNGANSAYQHSLRMLPVGWQTKEDVEQQTLIAAINHVTEAIDGYKKTLEKNPLLYQAQGNMKKAEELKKQLEEKLKQQPPQAQNKEQQQQNENGSSDKQTGDKGDSGDADHNKDAGENRPDQADKPQEKGQNNPNGNEKDKEAQQKDSQHNDQSKNDQQNKPSDQERKQADQEKQATEEDQRGQAEEGQVEKAEHNDKKETAMARAIFDSLKNDEAQSQKRFLNRQMHREKPLQHPGQKPW